MKSIVLASLLLLASCGRSAPGLQISNAWARETVAGQTGTAAYVTIENRGSGADRLLGISAVAPITATMHETSTANGISSMRPLEDGLAIPAGKAITLAPGGAHIMISRLPAPLREGEALKLTLRFEHSGDRAVDFRVASAMGGMGH